MTIVTGAIQVHPGKRLFEHLSKRVNSAPDAVVYTRIKLFGRTVVFSAKESKELFKIYHKREQV